MVNIAQILSLDENMPATVIKSIAARVKLRRLESNFTQKELSTRAGISLASYRRFERTGEISFISLVKMAVVLNAEKDFNSLFINKIYNSIEDVLNENKARKRGRAK
jgi:transcriptional regulator with XRE-family HTH domain